MKIISKYKDYYDYLKGIYGEDEKLILDRRSFWKQAYPGELDEAFIKIYIGGKLIEGFCRKGLFYYGQALETIATPVTKNEFLYAKEKAMVDTHYRITRDDSWYRTEWVSKTILDTDVNDKLGKPIVFKYGQRIHEDTPYKTFPVLLDLGLASYIPPTQIWLILTEWLGRQKDLHISNTQTDTQKILSKGFDLKTSFRGKNK